MPEYRRIIPPQPPRGVDLDPINDNMLPEQARVFHEHGLVYHMTTTEKWMTVEQVVAEMRLYRECWPDDTTDEECAPEIVDAALKALAAVGLEEVR